MVGEGIGVLTVESGQPDVVAKLSGKIDAVNSGGIQAEALSLIGDDIGTFTFDMNDVTYVSSAGLRMFSAVAKACRDIGAEYVLDGLRKDIARQIQLTGYASVFKIVQKEEV